MLPSSPSTTFYSTSDYRKTYRPVKLKESSCLQRHYLRVTMTFHGRALLRLSFFSFSDLVPPWQWSFFSAADCVLLNLPTFTPIVTMAPLGSVLLAPSPYVVALCSSLVFLFPILAHRSPSPFVLDSLFSFHNSAGGATPEYNLMYYLKGAAAGGICCSITHGALTPVDVVKVRCHTAMISWLAGWLYP